jgi:predicted metalloendopeptidase
MSLDASRRTNNVFKAQLAEQADRFEEMVKFMKLVVEVIKTWDWLSLKKKQKVISEYNTFCSSIGYSYEPFKPLIYI